MGRRGRVGRQTEGGVVGRHTGQLLLQAGQDGGQRGVRTNQILVHPAGSLQTVLRALTDPVEAGHELPRVVQVGELERGGGAGRRAGRLPTSLAAVELGQVSHLLLFGLETVVEDLP